MESTSLILRIGAEATGAGRKQEQTQNNIYLCINESLFHWLKTNQNV